MLVGLLGEFALVKLCLWQMDRLEWKQGILDKIKNAPHIPPQEVDQVTAQNHTDYLYARVNVKGTWRPGEPFFVVGRTHQKMPGYHLLRIMTLPQGQHLLVNFGWVPRKEGVPEPQEDAFVGRLRVEDPIAWLKPNHHPKLQEWGSIDIPALGQAAGVVLLPYYVDMVRPHTGVSPHAVPNSLKMVNNHLGYACIWGGLALVWGVIMGIQGWTLFKKKRKKHV